MFHYVQSYLKISKNRKKNKRCTSRPGWKSNLDLPGCKPTMLTSALCDPYCNFVSGVCQCHPTGYWTVQWWHRQQGHGLPQAFVPQGRLSEWKEHHPDHSGSMLLCKYLTLFQEVSVNYSKSFLLVSPPKMTFFKKWDSKLKFKTYLFWSSILMPNF